MHLSSYPQWKFLLLAAMPLFLMSSCKKDDDKTEPFSVDVFYKEMQTLTIEVAYEPQADPYDFNITGTNIWEFTEANIESLFAKRPINLDVIVPSGLSEMQKIPDQNKSAFTVNDIMGMASAYRRSEGNATDGNIFVVFLDGYFLQDDTVRNNVAGVNVVGTTVVAIFKPLVTNAHNLRVFREFIEQSVVIHETGHALGLVKNGLPLTSSHQDTDHGAHCTNPDCVMYWQNEHPTNLSSFVQNYYSENKPVIFGPECIRDVTEYRP